MKFTKNNIKTITLLIAFIALTASYASAAKKRIFESITDKSKNAYKLLILGDNGQVDYFFKRQFKDKSNNKTLIEDWHKRNLLSEQYNFKNFQCLVKAENKVFNLQKSEGLQNFEIIISNEKFKQILNVADGVVFLGDIIYPETKFLMYAKNVQKTAFELPHINQWRNRLNCAWNLFFTSMQKIGLVKLSGAKPAFDSRVEILAGNHSFDVDVYKEEDILLQFGSFENPNKKQFTKKSVLLTDEFEIKALAQKGKHNKIVKNRLNIGSNADTVSEDCRSDSESEDDSDSSIESFAGLNAFRKSRADKKRFFEMKPSLYPNKANHALGLKQMTLTKYPKFIEITFRTFAVQFIDFNSSAISCITEQTEVNYHHCNLWNVSSLAFAEAKRYFKRLYTAISTRFSASSETKTIWRALRAHHPPVNSEDGDSDFYFKDIKFSENPKKIYNLISLMKSKRVQIFFGSHIHNAQVMVYPYGRKYKKRTKYCKEIPKGFGCFEAPSALLNAKSVFNQTCSQNFKFDFGLNEKQKVDETFLYIFINGNSGRSFDALKSGKLSNGMVVWGRAVVSDNDSNKEHFGFSTANFTKDKLSVEFYEVDPQKNVISKVSEFNLVQGVFPKFEIVNGVIDGVFCKN